MWISGGLGARELNGAARITPCGAMPGRMSLVMSGSGDGVTCVQLYKLRIDSRAGDGDVDRDVDGDVDVDVDVDEMCK